MQTFALVVRQFSLPAPDDTVHCEEVNLATFVVQRSQLQEEHHTRPALKGFPKIDLSLTL